MTKATCTECNREVLAQGLCPTHYNMKWRADNAERYTHRCSHCGVEFKSWRKAMATCSLKCQALAALSLARLVAIANRVPGQELARYRRPRHWFGHVLRGRRWVQGRCPNCHQTFTGPAASAYCSTRCRLHAKGVRRAAQYGPFMVPDTTRASIYARDNFVCQLCFEPVDVTLHYYHPLSATLDHIEPQSKALTPDHSESNLRLAHRRCNSARGDASRELGEGA